MGWLLQPLSHEVMWICAWCQKHQNLEFFLCFLRFFVLTLASIQTRFLTSIRNVCVDAAILIYVNAFVSEMSASQLRAFVIRWIICCQTSDQFPILTVIFERWPFERAAACATTPVSLVNCAVLTFFSQIHLPQMHSFDVFLKRVWGTFFPSSTLLSLINWVVC